MTIGQLALRAGVSASAIRYWERIGLLSPPPRAGGQRRYTTETSGRLAVIRLAKACGFSLEQVRALLHGFRPEVAASERWRKLALARQEELDRQIAVLKEMRVMVGCLLECKCADFGECGRRAASLLDALPKRRTDHEVG